MKKAKIKVAIFMIMAAVSGIIMVLGCTQDEMTDLNSNQYDIWKLEEEADTEFMPLNSVPEWIKDKVTKKEYEAWVRLSSRYEIDYSVLSLDLTESQKKDLYQYIDTLYALSKDSADGKSVGCFTVVTQSVFKRIETLSNPEVGGETHGVTDEQVVYHAIGKTDVYVKATIDYTLNSSKDEILKASPNVFTEGSAAKSFNGSYNANILGRGVELNCSGSLTYELSDGSEKSDSFNKKVNFFIFGV